MVNLVAVFLVYLCVVHQVCVKAILTNINTEAGVLTLLALRVKFYTVDYDDDNMVDFENSMRVVDLYDLNNDGNLTLEEMKASPEAFTYPDRVLEAFDLNRDGVLNTRDIELTFESLPGSGNKLDLHEYMVIGASSLGSTYGLVMKIQSFVQAERDFLIIDEDDDNILTRGEFQVDFGIADQNKNGNLEESEVRNMFPMRSTPPECICPNITVNCSVDDVMPLFEAADTDNNTELNIKEYIQHFGNLIVNY